LDKELQVTRMTIKLITKLLTVILIIKAVVVIMCKRVLWEIQANIVTRLLLIVDKMFKAMEETTL